MSYVCNIGRVYPLAQSELCILTCCLWKGEKTRGSAKNDEQKHQRRCDEERLKGSVVRSVMKLSSLPIAAWIPKKGMRIIGKARRARFLGVTHLAIWSGWISLRFVHLALGVADADPSLPSTSLSLYDSNCAESLNATFYFIKTSKVFIKKNASNRENGIFFRDITMKAHTLVRRIAFVLPLISDGDNSIGVSANIHTYTIRDKILWENKEGRITESKKYGNKKGNDLMFSPLVE